METIIMSEVIEKEKEKKGISMSPKEKVVHRIQVPPVA
jgi:hypothetical protein